jgi:hypothetical protein
MLVVFEFYSQAFYSISGLFQIDIVITAGNFYCLLLLEQNSLNFFRRFPILKEDTGPWSNFLLLLFLVY